MLGLDADASDSDGEHMVFDPSCLRDASDFVSVDVRVVEYKGRTLFHTKAFLMDTMDCLKENILAIIYAKTPAKHFHRRMSMDGFDLLYDDKTMDESLTLHDYSDEGVSVHTVALHLKIKGGGLSRGVSKHIVKSKGEKQVVAGDANGFQTTFNTCVQTCGNGNFSVNRHCCVGCHGAIWPLLQCNSLKRLQHTGRTIAPLLRRIHLLLEPSAFHAIFRTIHGGLVEPECRDKPNVCCYEARLVQLFETFATQWEDNCAFLRPHSSFTFNF